MKTYVSKQFCRALKMEPLITFKILLILILCMPHIDTRSTVRPTKLVSYSIPENQALKKALGYHEDTYLNFTELATKYKNPSETHTVTTEDGYILTVFRLLPKCSEPVKPFPIMLMHGFVDSSDAWILAGPKVSLGFLLTNNCYDVWAANHRGNVYSRRHVKLDPDKDADYWNYSFHEHGIFDVPAVVDYILKATGKSQLYYIGHSQGTTDGLVMNSMKPEYNDKIRLSIYLAPVAWMKNIASIGAIIGANNADAVKILLESAGIHEIFGKHMILHHLLEFLCQTAPDLCEIGLTFSTGHKPRSISQKTLSVAFGHLLAGSSVKTGVHLTQLIVTGRFQYYDEGRKVNMKKYGSPRPPEYNVSRITCPVVLVNAQNDGLSSLNDIDTLASKLPNLIENYVVPEPYWSHHNHLWGINVFKYVNSKILGYLDRFNT